MQVPVATLIVVTSAVILTCLVVEYAVAVFDQTLDTEELPQMDRIRSLESRLLNQTRSLFNQTEAAFEETLEP
ncbi:MAG: hypothetical protein ACE14S_08315 [Candidatus Bathyarchaeia archaeon]